MRGGLSDYVSDDDLIEIEKKFPASEIHTIEGASHWVHAEKT